MWLFVALLVGGAFLLGKKSATAQPHPRALPPGAAQFALPGAAPCPPSPMDVLCQFVSAKKQPPPMVVMCALAQVESMGRSDLAHDIIRLFGHLIAKQGGMPAHGQGAPAIAPPNTPPQNGQNGAPPPQPQSPTPGSGFTANLSDEQIQAMLNADPRNFVTRVQRGDVIDVPPGPEQSVESQVPQEQMQAQPMADEHEYDQGVQVSGTVISGAVAALPSPIRTVDADRWSAFTERLAREEPTFMSARHVGRFRQRKERLSELGINPNSILGNPNAQRHALDRDLADAHRHALDGGMAEDHVNRTITLPGNEEPIRITLSGVLGVIQAAGLEGAVSWLESYHDRRRFPHTTQAFLRTNNVF